MTSLADVAHVDTLDLLASYLLDDIGAKLAALGVTVPTTKYREPGNAIAWDGEQWCASLIAITPGQPGAPRTGVMDPNTLTQFVDFDLLLLRFVPSLTEEGGQFFIPDAAQIDDAAAVTIPDASGLYVAGVQFVAEQHTIGATTPVGLGPVTSVGPQGGVAGSMLRLSVMVW